MRSHRRVFARLSVVVVSTCLLLALSASLVLSADSLLSTVTVGSRPTAVAVNPVSHRVYVANYAGGSVSILDGVSDTVSATVSTGGGMAFPLAVVVDPLAVPARAYVGNFWSGKVTVIDESSLSATATLSSGISMGGGPRALALDPTSDPPKLFAAVYGRNVVRVWNATSGALIQDIQVGGQPRSLALYVGGGRRRLFAVNRATNSVTVIDAADNHVISTIAVGAGARCVVCDPDTGYAYVTSEYAGEVTIIDGTDAKAGTIAIGASPRALAIDAIGDRLFVANYGDGTVSVIRTGDNTIESTVTVGTGPCAIAFDSGDRKAYVTNNGSGSVTVIDSALSPATVAVGAQPNAVAVDEGASPHKAYVSNYASNSVSVLSDTGKSIAWLGATPAFAAEQAVVELTAATPIRMADGSIVMAGTAASRRAPCASPIAAVFWRLRGETAWRRAEITAGGNTTHVEWRIVADAATADAAGGIEVAAMDAAGAVVTNSDGGTGGVGATFGGTLDVSLALPIDRDALLEGGGWLSAGSPKERVTFGVEAYYPPEGDTPVGSLTVQLPSGAKLAATRLERLSVVERSATLTGECTLGRLPGYRFELRATDGGPASARSDAVALRVWDPTGTSIYSVDAPLGGGNVTAR
ncbi:MAG: YncE family protein [Coriobacteriia bacterium]